MLNRKWARVLPKLGWVRFGLSRAMPSGGPGMARITRTSAGRWHVSFPAAPPHVPGMARAGRAVGIDRGVATTIATSDGQMLRAPIMGNRERGRLARWHTAPSPRRRGSAGGVGTKATIAQVPQQVADRRRNWVEKTTTGLAAHFDLVAVGALPVGTMVRRPKPTPDVDDRGRFLPTGAAAKAGLNRAIHTNRWPDRAAVSA